MKENVLVFRKYTLKYLVVKDWSYLQFCLFVCLFYKYDVVCIRLQLRRPWFGSWVGKIPWRRDRLSSSLFLGFPGGSDGKESACNAGDPGLVPGLGRSTGEGKGYPLQYSWASLVAQLIEWSFKSKSDFGASSFNIKLTFSPLKYHLH